MPLSIYNTLKNKKEFFTPLRDGEVRMYVCGPTVYDVCHMGHARAAIVFDVIYSYLKFTGYHVTYVRNITDIDDKIIRKANDEGVDFRVITDRYIKSFHDDMVDLGNKPPTHEPKATEHIEDIIFLIERLIGKGMAYQVAGDVYYSVDSFRDYGKLSSRKIEDMIAGARIEVDERKKNPLDFALWKGSKTGEPWWESPWGKGRPGWHIECSAMSAKLLGDTFDIHGGGRDLIFPHHENEVAQSEGASGKPFARYWIHNGFVTVNKEKMSKSLGNFFAVRDMLNRYHSETIRLFLLTTHYRHPIDYTDRNLRDAETAIERVYTTLAAMEAIISSRPEEAEGHREGEDADTEAEDLINSLSERFREAMDDDFNTAIAMAAIFDTVRGINRWINGAGFTKSPKTVGIVKKARDVLHDCGDVLGVMGTEAARFLSQLKDKRSQENNINSATVDALIAERRAARIEKNWKRADSIRDKLADIGVVIMDGPEGTTWEVRG